MLFMEQRIIFGFILYENNPGVYIFKMQKDKKKIKQTEVTNPDEIYLF